MKAFEAVAKLHDSGKSMILTLFARIDEVDPVVNFSTMPERAGEKLTMRRAAKGRFYTAKSFAIGSFILFFIIPLIAMAGTNEGSVLLYNDSPYILTATIQASDGTYLGQFTIQPGQQQNFSQNLSPTSYTHPGAPAVSLTPYTVIWQCPSEDLYSVCNVVGPGAMVRANDCPGVHGCKPKEKSKQDQPASTLQKKK